ncbi:hypothetical protein ES705_36635 [subsurface metagenome]
MIKAFIENYETLTIVGVFGIMMAWYLWHQTRATTERQEKYDKDQKEERDYYRGLVKDDLQKNVDLNVKGITLQKEMMKEIKDHDGQSREAWSKLNGSLGAICERLNNKNPVKDNKKNGRKK